MAAAGEAGGLGGEPCVLLATQTRPYSPARLIGVQRTTQPTTMARALPIAVALMALLALSAGVEAAKKKEADVKELRIGVKVSSVACRRLAAPRSVWQRSSSCTSH